MSERPQALRNIRVYWGVDDLPTAFELTFFRDGEKYQTTFSSREWGSPGKAMEAALKKAEQLRIALGPQKPAGRPRTEPLRHKQSTGLCGVTRSSTIVKGRCYLRYNVDWYDGGGAKRNKVFSFGVQGEFCESADREFHAFRTASFFRHLYVFCTENDIPFYAEWFYGWKERRIYEELRFGRDEPIAV